MTWLIIVLVLVVAIGPALYLLPSARDKRLTGLREQARKQGLSVSLTRVRKLDPAATERVDAAGKRLDPQQSCVSYARAVRATLLPFQDLQLLKLPAEPTVPHTLAVAGWALAERLSATPGGGGPDGESRAGAGRQGTADVSNPAADLLQHAQLMQQLADLCAQFPSDTLAVELSNRAIACLWQERADVESSAVTQIRDTCERIEKLLEDHINGPATTPETGE